MTTQKILFEPEITLPPSDKILFDVCNDAHNYWNYKQVFYTFKVKILEKYATKAGVAKQTIKKECHTCDGTGFFQRGVSCLRCDRGIYEIRTYYLQRWVMNGDLYFVPVIYKPNEMGPVVQEFEGYVSDWVSPHPIIKPDFAYCALMYKYDKQAFNMFLIQFQSKLKKDEWKKWGEISKGKDNFIEAFAEWCGLELQNDKVDDLPF